MLLMNLRNMVKNALYTSTKENREVVLRGTGQVEVRTGFIQRHSHQQTDSFSWKISETQP